MLLMAMATSSSSSGTGSFGATPLKSSSSWDVAEQTGAFSWKYEMPVTAPGAGPAPTLGLAYNSQSVDGETGSTNNQTSAVGEGWDLSGIRVHGTQLRAVRERQRRHGSGDDVGGSVLEVGQRD